MTHGAQPRLIALDVEITYLEEEGRYDALTPYNVDDVGVQWAYIRYWEDTYPTPTFPKDHPMTEPKPWVRPIYEDEVERHNEMERKDEPKKELDEDDEQDQGKDYVPDHKYFEILDPNPPHVEDKGKIGEDMEEDYIILWRPTSQACRVSPLVTNVKIPSVHKHGVSSRVMPQGTM